jgi:hypothetical protein
MKDLSKTVPLITQMRWGGDSGSESITLPLSGIFSAWTVRVPTDVELEGLDAIRLVFDIQYRAFEAQTTRQGAY